MPRPLGIPGQGSGSTIAKARAARAQLASNNEESHPSRSLRPRVSDTVYQISDDDDDEEEESEEDEEDEDDIEEEVVVGEDNRRRSIRERKQPERMKEYVSTDRALGLNRKKKKGKKVLSKKKKRASTAAKKQTDGDEDDVEGGLTVRGEERKALLETKLRRDTFYVEYRKLFEPLLPERNFISKLAEKREKEEVSYAAVPYKLLGKQPEKVKATLKPYQLTGLSFLIWLYRNGVSGILGDEMGLGKTLQTLSLFSYLTTYEPVPENHRRPFLVVCPLSVVSSWVSECARWTPHLKLLRIHGPTVERQRLKKVAETGEEGNFDVVVTSYETFEREKVWFRRVFVWRYVVLDEGHKIKNDKTNISQALQSLQCEYRVILTGTPLQNNLEELWALLHWLYPDVFAVNTAGGFADAFNLSLGKNNLVFMDSARRLLELVMIRRMKDSETVDLGLPPKTELLLYLPLSPMQRFWYKRLLIRLDRDLLKDLFANAGEKVKEEVKAEVKDEDEKGAVMVDGDGDVDGLGEQWGMTKKLLVEAVAKSDKAKPEDSKWRKLMNLVMQLRKCCDHPYLLPNAEPMPDGDHEYDYAEAAATLMLASSKFIFLNKLIEELCIKQGRKILVFSGFTKMLDLVEEFLYSKGGDGTRFKIGRLDGGTPRARRNLAIRLFNSDPAHKVMLISVRAGGLGINLASASDVVMLDTDWNPQVDLQAQARAHRIGQKNPVTVYRLIAQGTVEEQMMGRIRKKLYLATKVTESMRDIHTEGAIKEIASSDTQDIMPTMSTGQLLSLVRSGSRTIARPEIDPTEMLGWDWETMLQKCRDYEEELDTLSKTEESTEEEERRWLSEMEKVEARVFEGKVIQKGQPFDSNADIAKDFAREARRKGMNRVVMIGNQPVLKETIGNAQWEAVATFSGRGDPRLAEPKRERKKFNHQDYCQICYDGGELTLCSGCPRTYHTDCLTPEYRPAARTFGNYYCQQHQCADCEQKTANCGGLIFRCRWCELGYCEDCLDWDSTELIGESLPEFELLGFGRIEQAYYIKCPKCVKLHEVDLESRAMCEEMEQEWLAGIKRINEDEGGEEGEPGLTDGATTETGTEVNTPIDIKPSFLTPSSYSTSKKPNNKSLKPPSSTKKSKIKSEEVIVIDSDSAPNNNSRVPSRNGTPVGGKRARRETVSEFSPAGQLGGRKKVRVDAEIRVKRGG